MSPTDKTGALKVLWVPRYCPFAPKHPKPLCNHMYMPLAGPLCKILGSIPGSLRPLGEPIWPLECPRAPAGSRTITQNTLFPVTPLINCQGEYADDTHRVNEYGLWFMGGLKADQVLLKAQLDANAAYMQEASAQWMQTNSVVVPDRGVRNLETVGGIMSGRAGSSAGGEESRGDGSEVGRSSSRDGD